MIFFCDRHLDKKFHMYDRIIVLCGFELVVVIKNEGLNGGKFPEFN